jgi:DNA integrity scanning protein DisA with diadenylate cyclase activity
MDPAWTVVLSRREGKVSLAERGYRGSFNLESFRTILDPIHNELA